MKETSNFSITYRPKTLSEVYGQDLIIKDLTNRSKNNSWQKVMYFSGRSGIGKTTLARIIAKSIICNNKNEDSTPCNSCNICQSIDNEIPSNYYFEYNASNLNIEAMREIELSAKQRMVGAAKAKIFVIDELQELNKNKTAQKNLLKILESPNKYAYFILGAMDDSKVNYAIKNRGTPYMLKPLPIEEIANCLMGICIEEKIKVEKREEDILMLLAGNCGQSMRTAISFLERVIYSDVWEKNKVVEELMIVDEDSVKKIMSLMFEGNLMALDKPINESTLEEIRRKLNIIYKAIIGLDLNTWQKDQVDGTGFSKLSINQIEKMIRELNHLFTYVYLTPDLIEFALINCIRIVNEEKAISTIKGRRKP